MDERIGGSTAGGPVRVAVVVDAPLQRAFDVFTLKFDSWWPRSHSTGEARLAAVVIEPHLGGRWFERGVDGSEAQWGGVLAWEPPHHVLLAWQLDADWTLDPATITEVAVRFLPVSPERTRVELEHRLLERFGPQEDEIRGQLGSVGGWPGLLQFYVAKVEGRVDPEL